MMKMNYSSVIDSRGRGTVPREIRRRLELSAGDRVEFVIEPERFVLRPVHQKGEAAKRQKNKATA